MNQCLHAIAGNALGHLAWSQPIHSGQFMATLRQPRVAPCYAPPSNEVVILIPRSAIFLRSVVRLIPSSFAAGATWRIAIDNSDPIQPKGFSYNPRKHLLGLFQIRKQYGFFAASTHIIKYIKRSLEFCRLRYDIFHGKHCCL